MKHSALSTIDLVLEHLGSSGEPQTQRQIRGAMLLTSNQVQCALTRLLENGRVLKVARAGRHSVYLVAPTPPPRATAGQQHLPHPATPPSAFAQAPIWPAPRATAMPFGRPLLAATHAMEALQC